MSRLIRIPLLGLCAVTLVVAFAFASVSAHASPLVRSTGCGTPAPITPGSSAYLSLDAYGLGRSYLLHLPTTYSPSHPSPLVVAFHGHGNAPDTFESATDWSHLADLADFIVAYPQGSVGPDGQTGWNTGRAQDPTTNDIGFVDALIEHLTSTLCVNANRIYAVGFSNGGGLVALLACERSYLFTAFAIVAGDYVPQTVACSAQRPVPLLEIHSAADPINPYNGSASKGEMPTLVFLAGWAARDGCRSTPHTSSKHGVVTLSWTGCRAGSVVLHYRLAGLGHVWPITRKFNATSAIWAFLSQW